MLPQYTPATVDFAPKRTFQIWLESLQQQLPRYFDNLRTWINVQLVPTLNNEQWGFGADIASAATISPDHRMHQVTGSVNVATINAPIGFSGFFVAFARDGFATVLGGNIQTAQTIAAGHIGIFAYHAALQMWGVVTS